MNGDDVTDGDLRRLREPEKSLRVLAKACKELEAERDRLRAEVDQERARADANAALIGTHDPTGEDHLREMMEHVERADALVAENERLRAVVEALRTHIKWAKRVGTGDDKDEDDAFTGFALEALDMAIRLTAALDQEAT